MSGAGGAAEPFDAGSNVSEPSTDDRHAALSRELGEFLIELSIGVHRYAMYPPDHPSLAPVTESIAGRLAELFQDRESLSLGIALRQLVIDGVATDPKHPVLSELARRLHGHQLGALRFERGIRSEELGDLLGALAEDVGPDADPMGLRPVEEIPRFEHAAMHPVGYDALELRDGGEGGEGDRATTLWLGLARAALARKEMGSEDVPESAELARVIRERERNAAYEEVIAGYLRQLTRELRTTTGGEADAVRRRVSSLVSQLDERTLTRLVDTGSDSSREGSFLLDASHSLAVDSVLHILKAAAHSSGQTISDSMTRLLSKLAMHAEGEASPIRSRADGALREHVERLLEGWELADPNPEAYSGILDAMARSSPLAPRTRDEEEAEGRDGPERVLKTALEVDAWGPTVDRALGSALQSEEGTRTVLDLVREAPEESRVAEEIRARLTDPDEFRSLLAGNRVDEEGLRALLDGMGEDAIAPLLDVLADTDHRAVRRKVFDALLSMGPEVGRRAVGRLQGKDRRWFVLRNMLALVARLDEVPEDFDPQPFLDHEDLRVRREALPLAFRLPGRRDRALATALSDADERMVRMGLLQLGDSVPEAVLPTLINRVVLSTDRSREIRTLGVRALSGTRASLARSALLELALSGRSLFGKARLGAGPETIAALRVLAAVWSGDPHVRPVLEDAARSRQAGIRRAVLEEAG